MLCTSWNIWIHRQFEWRSFIEIRLHGFQRWCFDPAPGSIFQESKAISAGRIMLGTISCLGKKQLLISPTVGRRRYSVASQKTRWTCFHIKTFSVLVAFLDSKFLYSKYFKIVLKRIMKGITTSGAHLEKHDSPTTRALCPWTPTESDELHGHLTVIFGMLSDSGEFTGE